jgi:hypothetical protein
MSSFIKSFLLYPLEIGCHLFLTRSHSVGNLQRPAMLALRMRVWGWDWQWQLRSAARARAEEDHI